MNSPFKSSATSAIALAAAVLLPGCAHHDKIIVVQPATQAQPQTVVVEHDRTPSSPSTMLVVHDAPPPARDETMPSEPPSPDQAWAPGHWEYQDNKYVWVAGRWVSRPQPNAVYVAPHWESRSDGWVYMPGTWKQ